MSKNHAFTKWEDYRISTEVLINCDAVGLLFLTWVP
jgi:hypothetical protein